MGAVRTIAAGFWIGLASLLPAGEKAAGVDLKFVSDVAAIQPGVPFTVALHLHHHEGYHTYWKEPGIVGLPTSLDWKLPEGFRAGPIAWPAPEVVDMAGHPAHGYHRDVLLMVEMTPPKEIASREITLSAEGAWMACARTCHPGFKTISLTLPVNTTGKPRLDPVWSRKIAAERAALPAPCPDWTAVVESAPGQSPILLRLTPKPGSQAKPGEIYFFSEDGQVSSEPLIKTSPQEDGSYLLSLPRCEFDEGDHTHLPGILSATGSWTAGKPLHAIRINPAYPAEVNSR